MTQYNTDIQMIMDFLKLSFIIDDPKIGMNHKKQSIELQKALLELLPVAQSHRISAIYDILHKIYISNTDMIQNSEIVGGNVVQLGDNLIQLGDNLVQSNDNYLVLFYDSICSQCQKILPVWNEFKQSQIDLINYQLIDYDIQNSLNRQIFDHFDIGAVPTIYRLNLASPNYKTEINVPITIDNLNNMILI
jgi:hypothetical protein